MSAQRTIAYLLGLEALQVALREVVVREVQLRVGLGVRLPPNDVSLQGPNTHNNKSVSARNKCMQLAHQHF